MEIDYRLATNDYRLTPDIEFKKKVSTHHKTGHDTPYLYLLCGKHSIAILSEDWNLYSVVRILDGRTDYAKTAFSLR